MKNRKRENILRFLFLNVPFFHSNIIQTAQRNGWLRKNIFVWLSMRTHAPVSGLNAFHHQKAYSIHERCLFMCSAAVDDMNAHKESMYGCRNIHQRNVNTRILTVSPNNMVQSSKNESICMCVDTSYSIR